MRVTRQLATLVRYRDFRRLLAVRLCSQSGDGLFQAGLAMLFFFSPETLASTGQVALAFTVLLLPFTLVAPFAGPLLDRWRRRNVLVYANVTRAACAVGLALWMWQFGVGAPIYLGALITLGINRFLLSALSAGLPRCVPGELLLMANSITPTLGAAAAVIGAAVGFVVGLILPPSAPRDPVLLCCAAVLFGAAALIAARFGVERLGPSDVAPAKQVGRQVAKNLADMAAAWRYLRGVHTPAAGLSVMAAHRFLFGINFIMLIVMSRNLLADPHNIRAGLATFALLSALTFVGGGAAIIATPIAHQRLTPAAWIVVCLYLGAASQLLAAIAPRTALIATAAFVLGLSVQGAKIAVDTIVQRDTADHYRGRAFALYDLMYNAAFVGAAALAALVVPVTGWSRLLFCALGGYSCILAVIYQRHHHPMRR